MAEQNMSGGEKPAERPYFSLGIESLEALAQAARGNALALKAIIAELKFRKRPRARKLLAQTQEYLDQCAAAQKPRIDLNKRPRSTE